MLKDIVDAQALDEHRLYLRVEGEIDAAALVPFEDVFAPLRDPDAFKAVRVDADLGAVCCPNGADLDPDVLYALVTGQPVPDLTRRAEAP